MFTNSGIYSSTFQWNISHVYTTPDNYSVLINASNFHFSSNIVLADPIIIQIPVPPFNVLSSGRDIKTSDGYVSFEVILSDNTHPTDVFCVWYFHNRNIETVYSPSLSTGLSAANDFNYTRVHVGNVIMVNVTCF